MMPHTYPFAPILVHRLAFLIACGSLDGSSNAGLTRKGSVLGFVRRKTADNQGARQEYRVVISLCVGAQ